jgi:hypothetical protein
MLVREFLFKNFVPFTWYDSASPEGQTQMANWGSPKKSPVIECDGEPSGSGGGHRGFRGRRDFTDVRDMVRAYRLLLEPVLAYIHKIADLSQPNETITVVVPQFVPRRQWHNILHAQTAILLRLALLFKPGIVITNVPYVVDSGARPRAKPAQRAAG